MSRRQTDREDLFREASALVRRAEWTSPSGEVALTAGFRRDGGVSLYFGADPCYHFNPQRCLKRAYCSQRLYRTQGATLAELTRHRTGTSTQLVRNDLDEGECGDFLAEMAGRIEGWKRDRNDRRIAISRIVPENDTELENDLAMAIQDILENAAKKRLAPRYRGKR